MIQINQDIKYANKQSIKLQIIETINNFKKSSYLQEKIKIKEITHQIFLMDHDSNNKNNENSICLYKSLLDIFPETLEFIDPDTQFKMIDLIENITKKHPYVEKYKTFNIVHYDTCSIANYKNKINRCGDFNPTKTYLKANLILN